MEHTQVPQKNICTALSLLAHICVLTPLFLSFVIEQQQYKKENELTNPIPAINTHLHPTISAPVVLYSGPLRNPNSSQQPAGAQSIKTSQASISQPKPQQSSTAQQKPARAAQKKIIKAQYSGPIIPAEEPLTAPTVLKPQDTTKTKEENKESQQSKQQEMQKTVPDYFKAAEQSLEQIADTGDIRKRRLTLADLFKTMPHLMNKLSEESGDGEQLVVVQGDMKYYSFLKTFLTHINQVFTFHGGPQKLAAFAQQGKLKRNAGLSVVIDRQGHVLERTITHSSGHSPADQIILESIDLASPFPPVPQHFTHKTVRVELVSMVH